jgi:hypothetical protein
MKIFLKKFLLFLTGFIVLLNISAWLVLLAPNPVARHFTWFRVYERILRAHSKIHSHTLYIGDSVGNQFFRFENTPNSLTTNGAILMAGHYMLASIAVENNPGIRKIVLATVPTELFRDFEKEATYNNLLKPFFTFDNLRYFSPLIYNKMKKKPLSFLCIFKAVKILPFSDINFLNDIENMYGISDVALEYLVKLKKLCNDRNIELKIVSLPVPAFRHEESNNWEKIRDEIRRNRMEDIFGDYLDNIIYLDPACFRDRLHLKDKYLEMYKKIIRT